MPCQLTLWRCSKSSLIKHLTSDNLHDTVEILEASSLLGNVSGLANPVHMLSRAVRLHGGKKMVNFASQIYDDISAMVLADSEGNGIPRVKLILGNIQLHENRHIYS